MLRTFSQRSPATTTTTISQFMPTLQASISPDFSSPTIPTIATLVPPTATLVPPTKVPPTHVRPTATHQPIPVPTRAQVKIDGLWYAEYSSFPNDTGIIFHVENNTITIIELYDPNTPRCFLDLKTNIAVANRRFSYEGIMDLHNITISGIFSEPGLGTIRSTPMEGFRCRANLDTTWKVYHFCPKDGECHNVR